MAYHKWDAEYFHKKLLEESEINVRLQSKIADLQKELSTAKKKMIDFVHKPVLFIEQGSMLEPMQQIELNFQFRVVWLKQGAAAPIIYEPKRPA